MVLTVLFFITFLGAAQTAPTTNMTGCTSADTQEFLEINAQLFFLNADDEIYHNILRICSNFTAFFDKTNCSYLKTTMRDAIENYCNYIEFESTDFQPCFLKLVSDSSPCFEKVLQRAPPLLERASNNTLDNDSYCKNYFGADNCMKKTVISTCGYEKWTEYKKARIYREKTCDFTEGVNHYAFN